MRAAEPSPAGPGPHTAPSGSCPETAVARAAGAPRPRVVGRETQLRARAHSGCRAPLPPPRPALCPGLPEKQHLKRLPAQPKQGRIQKAYKEAIFMHPTPYEILA